MSAALKRDPAKLHTAGKIMAKGKAHESPLQPTIPIAVAPSVRTRSRPGLLRHDRNGIGQAENAIVRERPEIARVIGASEGGMQKNGVGRNTAT